MSKIMLKSSDGESFEVEEAVAFMSQTIKHVIEDTHDDNAIPLPNVTGMILAKVIEYCKKRVESGLTEAAHNETNHSHAAAEEDLEDWDADFMNRFGLWEEIEHAESRLTEAANDKINDSNRAAQEDLKKWDAEFLKVDQGTLFDLILAANYLNIRGLMDLTTQTLADMIKGKTPEEIRKMFNIKNDFTPEEEEEEDDRGEEDQWAFE